MSTIIKKKKDVLSYKRHNTQEIAQSIKHGLLNLESHRPRIVFAADYRKRNGKVGLMEYCALVTLHVRNLPGSEEVDNTMDGVQGIPYTHMAWRDYDGRSLYIVCRIAWREGEAPVNEQEMQTYQTNAYRMLHYVYCTQLQMRIDTEEPTLDYAARYSEDADMYYNADSLPFYVNKKAHDVPAQTNLPSAVGRTMKLLPGMDESETRSFVFHSCRCKALVDARQQVSQEGQWEEKAVCLLARYCFESNLPLPYAREHAEWVVSSDFSRDRIDQIFENAYEGEIASRIGFGHVERTALLTLRTEAFLRAHYDLRRNVLTGIVQYREKSGYDFSYSNLTEQAMNSMTIRALKAGLGSWDKDIRRLINSKDVMNYNPLHAYLYDLPKWDGRDRVREFCERIPSTCPDLHHYLHTWLLSMVAHWLGKDRMHGNAIVPLFIGQQGCGKTTLASMILPRELGDYYNDKVDFRSESDLMSSLSRFALINIDEFDALKKSQQPTLKYLLSKSEVKVRPIYGKAIEVMPRYASFIATTNLQKPLVDRTGSRRFVCIRILDDARIDTTTPIDHRQMYAQLMEEIDNGVRYWLDDEETKQLQQHNAPFLRLTSLTEIIDDVLMHADGTDADRWMTGDEILSIIMRAYPNFTPTNNTSRELGRLLREKEFASKRTSKGMNYAAIKK